MFSMAEIGSCRQGADFGFSVRIFSEKNLVGCPIELFWWVVSNMNGLFSISCMEYILSFPLTIFSIFPHIFQRGW